MAEDASEEEIFANGMSAVKTSDLKTAEEMEKRLAEKAGKKTEGGGAHAGHGAAPASTDPEENKTAQVMQKELQALIVLARGNKDDAVALLREAVAIEETKRPPNGAADPIKPSHELLGEVLLEVGDPGEAAKMFDASLLRMPNRARALLGSARAHAASGDRTLATERYAKLCEIWTGHEDLKAYQEAKAYLSATDDR
jgi:tetratricopeptide (TPR) repeat protein